MRGERVLVTGGAGFIGSNLAEALAEENDVVDDMVMSPTYSGNAAGMIRDILMEELPSGIYHVANSGYCSLFDFAKAIFDTLDIDANLLPVKKRHLALCGLGVCRHTPSFDKPFLKVSSAPGSKAKRPMFSALVSARLKKYGLEMPRWEYGLRGYLIEKGYFESAVKTKR